MNKTDYTELIEKNIDKTLIDAFNCKIFFIKLNRLKYLMNDGR